MHHEVVAELMPSRVLAVLHADIDENKRLLQIALLDDPLGKRRVEIVGKLHTLSPSAARRILRVRVRAYYIAFSSLGREALWVIRSLVPARRSSGALTTKPRIRGGWLARSWHFDPHAARRTPAELEDNQAKACP
jgi:hypothetical protein